MKDWLNEIREPGKTVWLPEAVCFTGLFLLLGGALGTLSKWLDNLAVDDTVWWQHLLGVLDLGNVFSMLPIWLLIALAIAVYSLTPARAAWNVFAFFAGMCISYHIFTVKFSGFNPQSYMMIWYGLTLFSPVLACLCWYGKGKTVVSTVLDALILGVMMTACFSIGLWYFELTSVINTLIFLAAAGILYTSAWNTTLSLAGAAVLAFGLRFFL